MHRSLSIKIALAFNYILFALLLNSVGTVILQVQRCYGVAPTEASVLEAFKDLSIAGASFLAASLCARLGYKRCLAVSLTTVTIGCVFVPSFPTFWAVKAVFALVGVSFSLTKVAVYGSIGLLARDKADHARLMSYLEGIFMGGILLGYFLFAYFVGNGADVSDHWLRVYYIIALFGVGGLLMLWWTPEFRLPPERSGGASVWAVVNAMARLIQNRTVAWFALSAFLFVLVEQGIMTWLPTFNFRVLQISSKLSVELSGLLAMCTGLGRIGAGVLLRKFSWFQLLCASLLLASGVVLLAMPLARLGWRVSLTPWITMPVAGLVLPLVGLFLAPVYPIINSVVLSRLPATQHGPMTGMIVIFSALGGTTGSLITGAAFQAYGGEHAFHLTLVPIALLVISLFFLYQGQRPPLEAKMMAEVLERTAP